MECQVLGVEKNLNGHWYCSDEQMMIFDIVLSNKCLFGIALSDKCYYLSAPLALPYRTNATIFPLRWSFERYNALEKIECYVCKGIPQDKKCLFSVKCVQF